MHAQHLCANLGDGLFVGRATSKERYQLFCLFFALHFCVVPFDASATIDHFVIHGLEHVIELFHLFFVGGVFASTLTQDFFDSYLTGKALFEFFNGTAAIGQMLHKLLFGHKLSFELFESSVNHGRVSTDATSFDLFVEGDVGHQVVKG